jgi:CheY-like chemotaxis protein
LLVDDDQVNIKFGYSLLKRLGHIVTTAENGKQCLAALENGAFDIALMYVQMQVVNGEEVLLEIRAKEHGTTNHLPVIALTAYSILLVEDEDQVKFVAKVMLNALGFKVFEASNGREALELYQNNASDIRLVLTDIGMPVMDGYTLFWELKALRPGLPIIISSGFGDTVVTTRIPSVEIAGLVSKP